MSKTLLNKIGVSNKDIEKWLKAGLRISYPMLKNKKFYKSEDGFAFVENGDKYVVPLSKEELNLYTTHPDVFKNDFLKNVKFYTSFVNWIHDLRPKTDSLNSMEKFTALLIILYLFQRAMDHHYYHFDRYLVYQDYPDTPVGFWWNKLIKISRKIAVKSKIDFNIVFLELLSNKNLISVKYNYLTKEEFHEVDKTLKNIRVYEDCQEEEVKLITDFHAKENILFRTALPVWTELTELLKNNSDLMKQEHKFKIKEIIENHPLIMTRVILSPTGLEYLRPKILRMFEQEIKRWVRNNNENFSRGKLL